LNFSATYNNFGIHINSLRFINRKPGGRGVLDSTSQETALRQFKIDEDDLSILRLLQEDARITREQIAKKLKLSKSAVQYRIKNLENSGVIEGYYAKINPSRMGKDYQAITLVRAKYSPNYYSKLGRKLAMLKGVWAVYYTFGDNDFVLLTRGVDKDELMVMIEEITKLGGVERTSSQIVIKTIKEDPRLEI
jgi:Lrp/AsnC family leucine-responsive transcriptional regulator